MKRILTSPPILAHPDMKVPFVLYTDASGFCLGAVLEQSERVTAYAIVTLLPPERRYAGAKYFD